MDTSAGKRCRVLALAPNPWDGQWMNRQQILSRLCKQHPVVYSNGPWRVWDRSREAFKACPWLGEFSARDGVLVDRAPRILLSWPRHAIDRVVLAAVQRRWRRQLSRMGSGPVVLYLFHPSFARYVEGLPHDILVYHPYDLFRRMPGWHPVLADQEAALLQRADLVIATSEGTREELASQTTRPVVFVPNGVDTALFARSLTGDGGPDVLASLPRPRIGYVGSLNRKVDMGLVAHLAVRRPAWQFIFIGPDGNYDAETQSARDACQALKNVHFLGSQPRDQLPACMRALDVGLMCYRLGTWMDGAYPLKLNEYLASGIPVVSSDLHSVRDLQNVLTIARTPADWETAIEQALAGRAPGTVEERRAVASQNSWDTIVARIAGLITGLITGRPGKRHPVK